MNFKNETIDMLQETTWWERRSKLEKLLLAATLVALLIILSLIIALNSGKEGQCESKECIELSNNLLNSMDMSVDPCDDFSSFVCGNLMKNLYSNKANVISVYKTNAFKVREQIRRIVEEPVESGDPYHLIALKNFYRACMNSGAIEAEGLRRVKGILRDIGGWPLLEGNRWRNISFDWIAAVHKLRKVGYDFELLLPISVDVDVRSGRGFIVYIDFPRIQDHQEKLKPQYFHYMLDMSVMMGLHTSIERKDLKDVFDFEMSLLKIYPEEKYSARDYTKYTIGELQEKFPFLPWYEYINGILYPTAKINFQAEVIIKNSNYVRRLIHLVQSTPKRTIANFIGWNVLHHLGNYLNEQTRMIINRHDMWKLKLIDKPIYIWENCVAVAASRMSWPILAELVKRHGNELEKPQDTLNEIVELIKMQYRNTITSTSWMDEATRSLSLEKLTQMKIHIGVPDKLRDYNLLSDIYEPVEVHEDKYLASVLNIDFLNTNIAYEKLNHLVEDFAWLDQILPFNLYVKYLPEKNSLTINSVYFGESLSLVNRENYVHFAGTGSLIAKEMAKLLTDGGFFTTSGVFQGWNSKHYYDIYAENDLCLKRLYTNNATRLNVEVSEPEYPVLEDIFGLKTTHGAYITWINMNKEDEPIAGLNFSSNQMFWVVYAYQVCTAEEKNTVFLKIQSKNLINEPLKHLDAFSSSFMCKDDSKMSKQTCDI